jgi:hypothetical protein
MSHNDILAYFGKMSTGEYAGGKIKEAAFCRFFFVFDGEDELPRG